MTGQERIELESKIANREELIRMLGRPGSFGDVFTEESIWHIIARAEQEIVELRKLLDE